MVVTDGTGVIGVVYDERYEMNPFVRCRFPSPVAADVSEWRCDVGLHIPLVRECPDDDFHSRSIDVYRRAADEVIAVLEVGEGHYRRE